LFQDRFTYSLVILIFSYTLILGQEENIFPIRIDKAYVVGNERTKSHIILREIPYNFPDTLSETDFVLIKNRIQNLYLFNRVELQITQNEDINALIIMVTESWYIFPVPLLFINEHDWGKLSYGLQLSHYNFRGRNEKLSIGGWFGYNPSFFLSYFNPWIGNNARLIFGLGFSKNKAANKIFDIEEDRLGFNVTGGKRITLNLDTQFKFFLTRIKLPAGYEQFTISGNGTDVVPTVRLQIKWDNRDLFEYPRKGYYFTYNFSRTGFIQSQPQFWRFEFDNRLYLPVYHKTSLAIRQLLVFNQGELPIYDRVFLGFSERIRGYFNDVFPPLELYQTYNSPHISLSSIELRFPLLPIKYFTIENGPIMPSLYRDLKFGISGGLFMDSGIAWQRNNEFALSNFYSGYGFGLHFHLPYVFILRFDYAINDRGREQFIIDAQVAF
jgi:outer membrane protein assembly factor BamA